jgi:hypothetical protein
MIKVIVDPRVQSHCQILITKLKRLLQNSQREDLKIDERSLNELLDLNPRTVYCQITQKDNFKIIFEYLAHGDTISLQQLNTTNSQMSKRRIMQIWG